VSPPLRHSKAKQSTAQHSTAQHSTATAIGDADGYTEGAKSPQKYTSTYQIPKATHTHAHITHGREEVRKKKKNKNKY